jgi:hypothetical protein
MSMVSLAVLATAQATATPTGSVQVNPDTDLVAVEINVTTAGTTATYQLEGSFDNTNWYSVTHVPSDTNTSAQTQTYTTTGRRILFLQMDLGKMFPYFRLNPTTVTGQVFSANLYWIDRDG